MEHRSKTRLTSAVLIAVVFGAGVLIGFAADTSLEAETTEVAVDEAETEAETRTPMWAQLDPSAAELAMIDSIVAVHRERTNALDKQTRSAYRQEFRGIILETRDAIKAVFPADKAAEYQHLLDEWDAQQAAEREDRDGRK